MLIVGSVLAIGLAGQANASGPSGSTECGVTDDDCDGAVDEDPPGDALDDPGENQADCNEATSEDVAGVQVYAGSNRVEVCSDGGAAGLPEGRVIATSDQGGLHCGDPSNQDATAADQSGNTPEDCNAG